MGKVSVGGGGIQEYLAKAVSAVTPSATPAIDGSLGNIFTLTPAANGTISQSGFEDGEEFSIVITTSGTDSFTLTFGATFKTTGTLATGTSSAKVFVISFIVVDGIAIETGRTAAM